MTSKELQAFISTYENKSISKAAERLYITQPALTRIIQKLETDIGTELFKRTRDGLKPTLAGEVYMKSAMKMLDLQRQLENQLSQINKQNKGRLTIGTTFFLGSIVLPPVVGAFAKLYPNIEITIIEGTSTEIENEISKGIVDLGIIHLPVKSQSLQVFNVGQEKFLIAVPPDDEMNTMAYKKEDDQLPYLDLTLLKNRDFVFTHPEQRARQEAQRICANAGFEPNIRLATRNLQTVSRFVYHGLGFSLTPSSYISLYSKAKSPNYYNIEQHLQPEWPVAVICLNELTRPAFFSDFIDICNEVLPQIYNFKKS